MKKLIVILMFVSSMLFANETENVIFKVYGIAPSMEYPSMPYPKNEIDSNLVYTCYVLDFSEKYYGIVYLKQDFMEFAIKNGGVIELVIEELDSGVKRIINHQGSYLIPIER